MTKVMALVDYKDPPRVKDAQVYHAFHRMHRECLHCGRGNTTAAHLLRGPKREDVLDGLVPLCGGGSSGCHGAFDEGHAYIGDFGRKVTPAAVRLSVAFFLRSEAGADHAAYLIRRLGPFGAEDYVQKLEASP
jgi:translation elongation factor EF-Tu-like GTPase